MGVGVCTLPETESVREAIDDTGCCSLHDAINRTVVKNIAFD
ncbi:MAG: hypothetical protein AB1560_03440 [Pseudomonadota bacterium]